MNRMPRPPPLPDDLFDQWRGLLKDTAVPSRRRVALAIWYAVFALATIAVISARFAPWVALSFIVIIRISAVLPLSADRRGLPGDIS